MAYAILQSELIAPLTEKLRRALRVLPDLREIDASTIARDAFGILIDGLSWQDASALQVALCAEEVPVEIVDQQNLIRLPPPKRLTKAMCLPRCFLTYDPLGKEIEVGWSHIAMVAAGSVLLSEFRRVERDYITYRGGPRGDAMPILLTDSSNKEDLKQEFLVEVFLDVPPARFHVTIREFSYHVPDQGVRSNLPERYICFVRDLLQFAPDAIANRGAEWLSKQPPKIFRYPTKHAFEEEIQWLLWKNQRQH